MSVIKSGTCGTCIWEIDSEWTLTIGPADGKNGVVCKNYCSEWPWRIIRMETEKIKKVIIKKGVRTGCNADWMFVGMKACTKIDAAELDTSALVSMRFMFGGCRSLTDISTLAKWNVSGVTDMSCLFGCCSSLKDISPLKKWNMSNVVDMSHMFAGCASLTDISPLSGWDVSNVRSTMEMFYRTGISREILSAFIPMACPKEGSFIGYKKCRDGRIVQLEVPEDAKRSSAYGRKCRCSRAKVLDIWTRYGEETGCAVSCSDNNFVYRKGETVEVEDFDEDRFNECAAGIHFFMTCKEAEDYVW